MSANLFEKIVLSSEKLTWSDILTGAEKNHSQRDVDYAIIAGTTLDSAQTETAMLQKWQRPWLYKRILKIGLAAFLAVLAAIVILMLTGSGVSGFPSINVLPVIIGPCIMPVTLMVFFWELNAPRNISLQELLGYFFTGGVFSIVITVLLGLVFPTEQAWLAPLTEEPAKLFLALHFLRKLKNKKGRVFALNGLAIGAAVGAGFAAFESIQYALSVHGEAINQYGIEAAAAVSSLIVFTPVTLMPTLDNIILRGLCALSSHVLYCAPYACLAALHMEKGEGILQLDFLLSFAFSFGIHMLWNTGLLMVPGNLIAGEFVGVVSAVAAATVLTWFSAQYSMRKAFGKLAEGVSLSGGTASTALKIQCLAGVHAGVAFSLTRDEILIGTDSACNLNYPVSTPGVSPRQCKLLVRNGQLYLADMGSMGGTVLNGKKLVPGQGIALKRGDCFSFAADAQKFTVI